MNIKRAIISLLFASLVPGLVSIINSLWTSSPPAFVELVVWLGIWYIFSLPLVLGVGFLSILLVRKLGRGEILLPPLIGGVAGLLISMAMYKQGGGGEGVILFVASGLLTGVVAALLYYQQSFRK